MRQIILILLLIPTIIVTALYSPIWLIVLVFLNGYVTGTIMEFVRNNVDRIDIAIVGKKPNKNENLS